MSISTVITLGYGSFGNTGYVITLGYDTSATPPPTPPSAPATGSGGGGRYYGYYPERARELRREIRAIVKQQKATERRLRLAPANADLARLAEFLAELQHRLSALTTQYEDLIHGWQASEEETREDEALLIRIFSDSFYE